MKLILRWVVPAILAFAAAPWGQAASYTITAAPGWNLIANQLDSLRGNGIRNVIPAAPLGSQIIRYNLATKAFGSIETYQMLLTGAQTWVPGTNILNPGDGLYFYNGATTNVVLTISGNPHVPVLPLDIGTGPVLVASQTNATATVTRILGYAPPDFTAVFRFVPGVGQDPNVLAPPHYVVYALRGKEWVTPPGTPPSFNVGESVWITTNGSLPSITRQPVSLSVCPDSKASFSARASGTPPLSYQWLLNGVAIRNATDISYGISPTRPSDSGKYTLQVSNPFGSVTSVAATLTVSDTEPPVVICPKDIVTDCHGQGGTYVEFAVGITDNCDPQPVVVVDPPQGSPFFPGVTTVVCTGSDASGNTNVCSFTVTVLDTHAPQIACPANKVVVATSSEGAVVSYSPVVTDDCDPELKVECSPPSGSIFPLGETMVVCAARDRAGNISSCTFSVTVVDQACCKEKSWQAPDIGGPSQRLGHSMAYDSARGRVVLFGGNGPNGAMGDTWEWDGTGWAQIPAEGPAARAFAAMAYDSRIGRVVMYGGRGGTAGILSDTWLWDGSKWQRAEAKPPGPRYGHAMAYDSARQLTVLYGGVSSDGVELDDTWEFDGAQWALVARGSPGPGPRQGHAMAYGSAQGQMLLFGGQTKGEVFDDTWLWDGKVWNLVVRGGPPPRAYHAMAYNDNCDSIVMFGGGANSEFTLSDTWEWDGSAWSLTATKLPTGRGQLAMAHDSDQGQTVLFGGTLTGKSWLGDTWLHGNDRTPPQVVSVDVACGDRVVKVAFDKPVSALSATSTNHYAVICGETITPVLQAVLTDDPRIVWLVTSEPISGGCILMINGVQDLCGRALRSSRTPFECQKGSPPSIQRQPSSLSVCPGSEASFSAAVSGTSPLSYQWSLNGVPIPNATNTSYGISSAQPSDSGDYTLKVWNSFGSVTSAVATLTVSDTQPPQIVCPEDKVVVATSPKGAEVNYSPTATDDCDPEVKVECSPPSGSLFPLGETAVVCVARDRAGNSSVCRFNVTVVDQSCCKEKSWQAPDIGGPGERLGHSMAYDSARGRVVLFGGNGSNGAMGDTWEWDGTGWAQMPAEGPAARAFAAMAYDSRIGRVVMYGGRGGTAGILSDTWLWDGAKWQRSEAKPAGPRYGHAMAYDNARQVTVLYGGVTSDGAELDDTWEFDGAQWALVAKGSPGPGPRQGHAMAYGSAQGQMLLFGGQTKGEVFDDTWRWDGKAWNLVVKGGPAPRAYHAMAYNDNCDSIVMFGGGANASFSLSDTWEWDGSTWSLTATKLPTGRGQLAMAHDSNRGNTVLFGGTPTGKSWLGDTWLYGNDRTAPQVVSVDAACGDRIAVVAFDKPVSALSAASTNHYAVICGQTIMPVLQAVLTDDPRIVWLYTSEPISGGCILMISGVQDLCGVALRSFRMPFECREDPCTRGSSGREFWLTFPGNYAPDPTNQPQPQVFLAGSVGTVGAAIVPGLTPPFVAFFSIPLGGVATINLPRATDLGDANDQVQTNAVHIVASRPVTAYGLNHVSYTSDAYLGLSTRAIGRTYIVMAYRNLFSGIPELNGSQFAVAAGLNNTTVLIVPSTAVGSHPAGVPYVVSLMRGQTYQLRCTNDAPADLTGSIIVADRPISVFGGHQCAAVPNPSMMFCDHLVEQMPPTEMWGHEFIAVPLATRSNGDTFRVLALLNNTTVAVNGVALPGSLNQGQVYEIQLSSASRISSNRPVLATQFANSSDYDLNPNSDPLMVVLQPTSLYSSRYILESPVAGFTANYLNLMVPNASVSQVVLDGVTLPSSSFTAVGASGYSGGSVPVGPGPHLVFTSSGAEFGVVAYGWSSFDAYGYAGSTCGAEQSESPRFTCPPGEITVRAKSECVGVVPDLTKLVGNAELAMLITQDPPAGTLLSPGTYTIKTIVIDPFGQRQICSTILTVTPGDVGLQCPSDIVTNCLPTGGQYVFYEVGLCNPGYTVTSVPPSGSLFTNGVTKVVTTATSPEGLSATCTFSVTVKCDVAPPTLGISQSGGTNLTLNWNGGGSLQTAAKLPGPWITVSNAVSPFRIRIVGGQGFYRVAQ